MRHERDWGGKRTGAGRRRKAATLGQPKRGVKSIHDFFGQQGSNIMGNYNSTPATTDSDDPLPDTHDDEVVQPPLTRTNGGDEGAARSSPRATKLPGTNVRHVPQPPRQQVHGSNYRGHQMPESTHTWKSMKLSGILSDAINSVDQKVVAEKIRVKGELWSRSTTEFVPQSSVPDERDLEHSWKMFYGSDVFTWRPDVMIPGWKPSCVSCGRQDGVGLQSTNREARLVYGIKRNYLVNSPIQWACKHCKAKHGKEATIGVATTARTQYCFSSHHPIVLDELAREHPGIRSLFPCRLAWRSGVDEDLIHLLFAAADSGMGPSAVSEFVKVSHYLYHQQCELRWLQFLLLRLKQPFPLDRNIRVTIQQLAFPAYDSSEICGKLPSQSFLCNIYCQVTWSNSVRMDSMHQRRIRSSKIFCMDASYKVPKWLASIHGEAMYSTLITAVNEYGETLASYFALSDNHQEIRSCLTVLQDCGFAPDIGFVDNVPRDGVFLSEALPTLSCHDGLQHPNEDSGGSLSILQLRNEPQYLRSAEDVIASLNLFEEAIMRKRQDNHSAELSVVSFDLEWSVSNDGIPSEVAAIAFGSLSYPTIVVVHIAKIQHNRGRKELLSRIWLLLANAEILFVGSNIRNDFTKLKNDFPPSHLVTLKFVNLGMMAVYRGLARYEKNQYSLSALTKTILQHRLPKDPEIRVSDVWTRSGALKQEAIEYLARDVESAILIYDSLKEKPDLSIRLKKSVLEPGLDIDIMGSRKTIVAPIASGRIVQLQGMTLAGIPLSGKRVLVEVSEVHKPESSMRFTQVGRLKCNCGSVSHKPGHSPACNIRTYRDAQDLSEGPFIIVEEYDRLRRRHYGEPGNNEQSAMPLPQMQQARMDPIDFKDADATEEPCEVGAQTQTESEGDAEDTNFGADVVDLHLTPDQLETIDGIVGNLDDDPDTISGQNHEALSSNQLWESSPNATPTQVALELQTRQIVASLLDDIAVEEEGEYPFQRVLGDAFHIMDRVRVPVHHDWKAAYFSALRDAIFLFDTGDKKSVESVLHRKGRNWEDTLSHNFSYLAVRVRRRIPAPKILHGRMRAVFTYFAHRADSKTGIPLFGTRAKKMSEQVLAAVLRGELSDPPGFSLYVPLSADDGSPKHDSDGLVLWRCLRGTGPAECAHSQYTRSFGQVRAGPLYSIAVLRNHHHRKSWRASMRNRPGFPCIHHYDCWLVDSVNFMNMETLGGQPKYDGWPQYDEAVPTKRSAFGIVPLLEESARRVNKPCEHLSPNMKHLATLMECDLPYTPVALKDERILFKRLLENVLGSGGSINERMFQDLTRKWNEEHVTTATERNQPIRIFPKYVNHLVQHYKRWRKNTKKLAAIQEAKASRLVTTLRSTRANVTSTPFHIQPIQEPNQVRKRPPAAVPQRRKRQHGVVQQIPSPQPLPGPPQGVQLPFGMAMPPTLPFYCPPYLDHQTNAVEPERVKRQRGICQQCYNAACTRPWNRKGVCNS